MKIPKIAKSVGQIDDDLVVAASVPARASGRPFVKWAILAASLGAVILVSALVLPMMLNGQEQPPMDLMPEGIHLSLGDLDRNYKDVALMGTES